MLRLTLLLAPALLSLAASCSSDDRQPSTGGTGAAAGSSGAGGFSGGSAGSGGSSGGSSGQSGGAGQGGSGGSSGLTCPGLNPAGCTPGTCATGTKCDIEPCAPSSCNCPTGAWACANDCQAGVCVGTMDCSAIASSLAQTLPATGGCAAVVRLHFLTLQVVSHTFFCSPSASPDEVTARATAETDTGFGSGDLLSGANPADAWVFVERNNDLGGVAAVSARTGLTVFGGVIHWLGLGKVTYPSSWEVKNIESTCAGPALPALRGIDLTANGSVLGAAETLMAAAAVARTAVPAALAQGRTLRESLVMRYGPGLGYTGQPGNFANDSAEYVVLMNAD